MRLHLLIFILLYGTAARAQDVAPTFKLEGEAALSTNSVEYGITQTDKDPSLHGSFWFNWGPQFRLGVWGGNVNFAGDEAHFLLKARAELNVNFSENASAALRFSNHSYFKRGTRDGTVIGLHLNLFRYGVVYEQISNFMGTEDSAQYVAFSKTWDVFQTWKWENQIGYVMLSSNNLTSYFDARSFLGTKPGAILYQIGATYNSSPAQFDGAAEPFLLLMATVHF